MLNRYRRTRALVEEGGELAAEMALFVENEARRAGIDVSVLDEPREELVMVRVRETAQGCEFFLGEALMTTCRVSVGACTGLGMVLGSDRHFAQNLAVIDAAFSGGMGEGLSRTWEARLREAERGIARRRAREQARVCSTRVDFSMMEAEL
ncbi:MULTISPECIES: phosphonate C-P lyase system protein PhnG [unclassified Adlercreutzia]|uniref:phosphonate C-P lyase system protein PhnG n=1 Tax=unclassified Adlercreutzia TaxID=2636013 RepID=UPI0013ED86BD|nr:MULTISPECIES: phosphonate C-P lyase system protein PhnG [unclassified Adlercreutzia]